MYRRSNLEMRVLILAPIGRDSALLAATLTGGGVETAIASDVPNLIELLNQGVGSVIIAEEALTPGSIKPITEWLAAQPPWSDPPFVVLTFQGRASRESHLRASQIQALGNFTFIERPARPETVTSVILSTLRARMRQYEIRSRQEALLRANADLEQFAHSASHDLREPLRSIGLYSDMLSRRYSDVLSQEGNEYLRVIHSSSRRMDALLTDLLEYAHASSIAEEALQPIEALGPLQTALANLAGAVEESSAVITVGELPEVRIRESHLSQVFQNLIANAIRYRKQHERPLIHVSAERKGGCFIFAVTDNGIGVPDAYKEKIFGIFKRLHSYSEYPGTGMGLAICQRIVERYHGRIWVESEPGKGSSFLFSLPA